MEYVLFIHNNVDENTTEEQWNLFFSEANKSGMFLGGSEISSQLQIGLKPVNKITNSIAGFMRFESEDKNKLLALLENHPVSLQGGSLELCEMPKS